MLDVSTPYLGLSLATPFVAGASPLTSTLDGVRRLEDGGAAAVVVRSLFEEQITAWESGRIWGKDLESPDVSGVAALFSDDNQWPRDPDTYFEYVRRLKSAVSLPVIASLNGTTAIDFLKYARGFEQAGADALEVNLYEIASDFDQQGIAVERQAVTVVYELKRALRIPVSMKLSPFFSAFGALARQLDAAGADGLVLFNRFYQFDIDPTNMVAVRRVSLSQSDELLLRLRWTALLHTRIRASLIVTGGVATPLDAIKALLAGADAVQIVSAALRLGPDVFTTMRRGLERWMEFHRMTCVGDMRGRVSLASASEPAAFERASYLHMLEGEES